MSTKDLVAYDSCKWQTVEDLCKTFPNIGVPILFTALIIESICLRD